jgi:aspartyl-tRNA(Asn)/glutamyl-tRNA(Gln) amidotransferase subunit A
MGSHSINSFFGPVQSDSSGPRSVGGSSGGSAIAVATQQCDTALGTDTGGSVRLPAAYTGVVGFKPSYGLISRWGVVPYANSLDTVGLLSRTIKNVVAFFQHAQGHDPQDPTSITAATWQRIKERRKNAAIESGRHGPFNQHIRKLKIGVPIEYNIAELDPGILQAWQNALKIFQEQGCTIVPVSLPNTKHALSAYYVLAPAEAASNLSKYDGVRYGTRDNSSDSTGDVLYSRTRGDGFGDEVKRRILLGSYTLSSEAIDNYFIKAQKVRRLVQRDFDRVFSLPNLLRPSEQFDLSEIDESVALNNKLGPSQVDFIVCPTAPNLPPTLDAISKQTPVDIYMNDVFTVPASLAGLPAISIPFPIPDDYQQPDAPAFAGIQIIGQYSDDHRLLETARMLEDHRPGPVRSKVSYVRFFDTKAFKSISRDFAQSRNPEGHTSSVPETKVLAIKWKSVGPVYKSSISLSHQHLPKNIDSRLEAKMSTYRLARNKKMRAHQRIREFVLKKHFGNKRVNARRWIYGKGIEPRAESVPAIRREDGPLIKKYISNKGEILPQGSSLVRKHISHKGENKLPRKPRSQKELDLDLDDAFKWWNHLER